MPLSPHMVKAERKWIRPLKTVGVENKLALADGIPKRPTIIINYNLDPPG